MYSKHFNAILELNEPVKSYDGQEITEFDLRVLNEFEEEIYYKIDYVNLLKGSSVNFSSSNIKHKLMTIKIEYDEAKDEINLIIKYETPDGIDMTRKFTIKEEEFIKELIDEMILKNNDYIYNLPMIKNIADTVREELFYTYLDNYAFITNTQTINTSVNCISREDGKYIATANRLMFIPEDESIILCEIIESSDLMDHEYLDLEIVYNGLRIIIERASLVARSRGKVKYACLIIRNATVTMIETDDEPIVFDNIGLKLPELESYLEAKTVETLSTLLYDNNLQNKINLFYKTNNLIDMILININNYLL